MSQTSLEPRTRAWLNWEWRAALIVIVGGAIAALAVTAWIHYRTPSPEQVAAANRAQRVAAFQTAGMVCTRALAASKNFGIVPNYAVLASPLPAATQVRGRYACAAATTAARYIIAVDLLCRELKNPRCVALYSVVQPDGTVLYRRQG